MSFSPALPEPPIASTAIAHARPATVAWYRNCVVVDVRSMVFKENNLNLNKKHVFFCFFFWVSLLCWTERCFSLKWTLSVNFLVNKKSIQILDFNYLSSEAQGLFEVTLSDKKHKQSFACTEFAIEICLHWRTCGEGFLGIQPEWCLEIWCPVIQTNEIFENLNLSAIDSELKVCFFQFGVFLSSRNLLHEPWITWLSYT